MTPPKARCCSRASSGRPNSPAGSLPEWQSSHPDPGNREVRIQQLAAEWKGRVSTPANKVEEAGYKSHLDGIVFGENPRNGFVDGSTFYHPDLRFQFTVPQGFQVQNDAQRVVLGNQQGQAIMQMSVAQQTSAQAAAQAFSQQQGIQVVNSGSDTVNGLRAAYIIADAQTEQGVIRIADYFIEYNGKVYDLAGLTSQQGFTTYQGVFGQFFKSFRALTDSRYLNVQPSRVNVVTASRTAPLRSLLPSNPPNKITLEDLAIANQLQLNSTVQAGAKIKTVQ